MSETADEHVIVDDAASDEDILEPQITNSEFLTAIFRISCPRARLRRCARSPATG